MKTQELPGPLSGPHTAGFDFLHFAQAFFNQYHIYIISLFSQWVFINGALSHPLLMGTLKQSYATDPEHSFSQWENFPKF